MSAIPGPSSTQIFTALAEVTASLADASKLEEVCEALERGRLTLNSAAATRSALAGGTPNAETWLRTLQEVWSRAEPPITGQALAFALRTGLATFARAGRDIARTQVVWTGPKVGGSFFRATKEVVRELIGSATRELLVVGYWISTGDNQKGVIDEIVETVAQRARMGVAVTIVLDERVRVDGLDNRGVLSSVWPADVPLPTLLTWHLPAEERHLKLHAKVMVVDRKDALVTSANLTSMAMTRNIEMGIRITGGPALDISRHFDFLASQGVIEPYVGAARIA